MQCTSQLTNTDVWKPADVVVFETHSELTKLHYWTESYPPCKHTIPLRTLQVISETIFTAKLLTAATHKSYNQEQS